MAFEVRPIHDDELEAWLDTIHVAFHNSQPTAEEVAYRRETRGQDYVRTLAALDGQRIVGTYESFTAELTMPGGGCVAANAVGAVSVLPSYHRRGLLTRMITADLQQARERAEVASILIAAEYPIYGRFGFGWAMERADYTLTTRAARFTRKASGSVDLVEPKQLLELAPSLFDRFRRAHTGQIDRRPGGWEVRLGIRQSAWRAPAPTTRCALYTNQNGDAEGYVLYTVDNEWHGHLPAAKLQIRELIHVSPEAYLGLWRFCAEVDLIAEVTAGMRCVEEPLPWLLENARAAIEATHRGDFLWVRPMDVERFLSARRYASEQRLVIEVSDPLGTSGGRFALDGGPDGSSCTRSTASPELTLSSMALGSISLGGVSVRVLAEAGAIEEHTPGAVDKADLLFHWPVPPWCSTFF